LHRSADIERQTLRTQQLGGLAFQLKDFNSRAEIGKTPSAGLVAGRTRVLDAANAKLELIRKHDADEGDRLQGPYGSYVRASSRAFDEALAHGGRLSEGTQQQVETTLTGLESQVDSEIGRLAHSTRVTNPQARLALIVAAVAAALLVGLLIWQFEMQRRAGRIDRDNERRKAGGSRAFDRG